MKKAYNLTGSACFNESCVACCGKESHRGMGCGTTIDYELCGDVGEYVFFDGSHPTERANIILSDFLWNGRLNFTWPVNMKQLYELNSATNTMEISSEDEGLYFIDA
ncbi:hypothetical protein Pint_29409 [Pistacia integerrima]|uniref:Uncharacterized protein n=2 Tax=Pistacia TaxID=55512 RepID=A0ACC0X108_9ROSI|nr:hypothetical protein Pint_29409 [Pistacia integerrima]